MATLIESIAAQGPTEPASIAGSTEQGSAESATKADDIIKNISKTIADGVVAILNPWLVELNQRVVAECASQILAAIKTAKRETAQRWIKQTEQQQIERAEPPLKNVCMFCSYQWSVDKDFRDKYMSERVQAVIAGNPRISNLSPGIDRLRTEGWLLWKKALTEEQKSEIREEFALWKSVDKRVGSVDKRGESAPLEVAPYKE